MASPSKATKIAVISVGLAAGVGTAAFKAGAGIPDGVIAEGVRVAGIDVGGKTVDAARAEIDGWGRSKLGEKLTVTLPESTKVTQKWTPSKSDLGVALDTDSMLAKAEAVGRDVGFFSRIANSLSKPAPVEIAPAFKADTAKIRFFLTKRVAPLVQRPPKDARFSATATGFKILPDAPGVALDLDGSAAAMVTQLEAETPAPVLLAVKTTPPHVAAAELNGIEGEVARYNTRYSETGNRRKNIETACSHINGTVLKPGDIFSYNKTVGPREGENGFSMAPVIINGRLKPGMGGGVCQTSSTLYNAVLLSDLKIVERSHHAFPVHYLPPGRDATVAYGDKDFRFANNTASPIAISADGTGGHVLMRIFGKKAPGRVVKIERTNLSSWGPETKEITDDSLPAGVHRSTKDDKGHAGHRVTVWRTVLESGKQVKREVVSRDYYQTFPTIVRVGTGPALVRPHLAAPKPPAASAVSAPGASPPNQSNRLQPVSNVSPPGR